MNSGENLPVQEIVIIRRKSDDGDYGHHGGMWKIAFADFMTAMMAFFLVMWLISASDEKTLDQLATYFNPIKLPDASKSDKALQNAPGSGSPEHKDEKKTVKTQKTETEPDIEGEAKESKHKIPEDALFTDPYGILSKLANQVVRTPLPTPTPRGLRKEDATEFVGGTAFRDPFDPDFRKRSGARIAEGIELQGAASPDDRADGNALASATLPDENAPDEGGEESAPLDPVAKSGFAAEKTPGRKRQAKTVEAAAKGNNVHPGDAEMDGGATLDTAGASKPGMNDKAAARNLESQIKETLRGAGLKDLPAIEVEQTQEGLLISLTDKLNFEMFSVASAQPRPELVVAMEKIGKLLLPQNGKIVVRGHTDSRAFRAGGYDNWRLSTDRAHIAHYMLARSGLPESRFERIEGHADRNLKIANDGKAASNRRIEILLLQPTS